MFAPAGAALSLDRLIRIRLGKEGTEIEFKSPWAQRMIQFQLAMVYFVGFWWKSMGVPWVSGTALYYVIHLEQIRRFPLPSFLTYPLSFEAGELADTYLRRRLRRSDLDQRVSLSAPGGRSDISPVP